ncbi:MAG: glycosyltransferase, partial [Ignavibacteria bacterium]|nr:glycosyltransferase [Ignavibacteria bacterium]
MYLMLLSQYFYPEMISTGQLLTELAVSIAKSGTRTSVICGQPTYYDNHRVPYFIEYNGISIYRVSNSQLNKNSIIGKILNSLSFFVLALFKSLALLRHKNAHLLIVTTPPFLPLLGYLIHKLRKTPYYILVHDVYPDIAIKLGYLRADSLIVKIWQKVFCHVYENCTKVIVIGRDMAEVMAKKVTNPAKIEIIENWADEGLISPLAKSENQFVI